jgi:hypothetical protein
LDCLLTFDTQQVRDTDNYDRANIGITSMLPSLLFYPLAYVVKSLGAKKGIIIGGIIRSSSALIYTFSPPLVIAGFLMDMGIGHPFLIFQGNHL